MSLNKDLDSKRTWWKEASVYQIYPASFQDSNNDGIGDIPGIISRLDYIKQLGVDMVWINPCFKSPQVDMGYDISDYKDIHEPYGTLKDIDDLIDGLHKRGIKFLMDLVANHTSDQHEWFKQSRSSKENPFRDWYIWKPPKYDENGNRYPPNNWDSAFRGSAWEYDEHTKEYYLHLFAVEQPDLNWENEKVREAIHDVIKFWLDKGVDGFRMDAINHISKPQDFPNYPVTAPGRTSVPAIYHCVCGPRFHEYLKEIGKILKYYDAYSVGETGSLYDSNEIIKIVGSDRGELNSVFNFEHVDMDIGEDRSRGKYTPKEININELGYIMEKYQNFMSNNDGWNALYLENHDQPRSVSRYVDDSPKYRVYGAKLLANFLALQSGTIFIYQGQELGAINVPKSWKFSQYKDLEAINTYNEAIQEGASEKELEIILDQLQKKSRDNARTPMPWNCSKNFGFTSNKCKPWINNNEFNEFINVENEIKNQKSVLNYWKSILKLRKNNIYLYIYGEFKLDKNSSSKDIISFSMNSKFNSDKALIVNNFSKLLIKYKIPKHFSNCNGKVILSNYDDDLGINLVDNDEIELKPYQSFVYEV